jgi:hypothetical protein
MIILIRSLREYEQYFYCVLILLSALSSYWSWRFLHFDLAVSSLVARLVATCQFLMEHVQVTWPMRALWRPWPPSRPIEHRHVRFSVANDHHSSLSLSLSLPSCRMISSVRSGVVHWWHHRIQWPPKAGASVHRSELSFLSGYQLLRSYSLCLQKRLLIFIHYI